MNFDDNNYVLPIKLYLLNIFVAIFLYFFILIFQVNFIVPIILILTGIIVFFSSYKKSKLILTPISIFSLIWLILIPICSFEYPVMRAMTNFEWQKVLLFIIAFSLGAFFVTKNRKPVKEETTLCNSAIFFCYGVLIVSILSLGVMFWQYDGIPLFADDANVAKILFRESSLFSTLSYFGFISILCLFMNNPKIVKSKLFDVLSFIYIIMLLLSGERFFITLLILSLLFVFARRKVDFAFLKKIFGVCGIVMLIFVFVLNFRGNESQKEKYFISRGIYSGTAKELTQTEFFRYMGMQQRLISQTYDLVKPGLTKGTLTFSPILKPFGIQPIQLPTLQVYGYTSKSIITKTYSDFGHLWCLAVVIISFFIHLSYDKYRKNSPILSKYLAIVWLIFLLLSFYAYFDNYIVLFLHFPIFIIVLNWINRVTR